jgi:hypothetical protein
VALNTINLNPDEHVQMYFVKIRRYINDIDPLIKQYKEKVLLVEHPDIKDTLSNEKTLFIFSSWWIFRITLFVS